MGLSKETQELVDKWLEWDVNEKTIAEIKELVEKEDEDELKARLSKRIAFGTAGLRGKMQAGFACMNDLTVIQASQGFVSYLLETDEKVQEKGVVIGYDGRYNSIKFARLAAATFMSKNVPVKMFNQVVATPLVPFAVLHYGLSAGLMVTASHNPKEDNGYKVFWDTGCQIISPIDKGISNLIEKHAKPWEIDHEKLCNESSLISDPTEEVAAAYRKKISELTTKQKQNKEFSEKYGPIVYTAMHGVGKRWVKESFETFGLAPYVPVPQQIEPNPDFPTVKFPNPEEGAGALLLSFKAAEKSKSRVVLANDPDSDRLAVAERINSFKDDPPAIDVEDEVLLKKWRVLTGNDIGALLTVYTLNELKRRQPNTDIKNCLVVNTTVSSKIMKAIADKEGMQYEEVLTGFKWIGTAAIRAIKEGKTFLFGFEEAIGNMVGDACFDKDGVRGAAVFAEMTLELYSKGETLLSELVRIGDTYGHYVQRNGYFFCYDPTIMTNIFTKLRENADGKREYATTVGDYKISGVRDLTTGFDNTKPEDKAILPVSSTSHMITYYFENGAVVTLRGSGTEPKLKYYIEVMGKTADEAKKTLESLASQLIETFLDPKNNNLK